MARIPSDVYLYGSNEFLFSIPFGNNFTVENNGIRDNSNGSFYQVDGTIDYIVDSLGKKIAIGNSDTSGNMDFYIVLKKPDRTYFIQESSLVSIADAIRTKTGDSEKLSLDDMPTAIASIESGVTPETPSITVSSSGLITATANGKSGTKQLTTQAAKTVTPTTSAQTAVSASRYTTGAVTVAAIPSSYVQPSGTMVINSNGTYDVKSKASVNVNVAGGEGGTGISFSECEPPLYPWLIYIPSNAVMLMHYGGIDLGAIFGATDAYYVIIGAILDSDTGEWLCIYTDGSIVSCDYGILEYNGNNSLSVVDTSMVFIGGDLELFDESMYIVGVIS